MLIDFNLMILAGSPRSPQNIFEFFSSKEDNFSKKRR